MNAAGAISGARPVDLWRWLSLALSLSLGLGFLFLSLAGLGRFGHVGAILAAASAYPPREVSAAITVNTSDDELNNDGDCSLREAIQAANGNLAVDTCGAGSGDDTITLPAGT